MQALGAVLAVGSLGLASLPVDAAVRFDFTTVLLDATGGRTVELESLLGVSSGELPYTARGFTLVPDNWESAPDYAYPEAIPPGSIYVANAYMRLDFDTATFEATGINAILGECALPGFSCGDENATYGVLGFTSGANSISPGQISVFANGSATTEMIVTLPDVSGFANGFDFRSVLPSQFTIYNRAHPVNASSPFAETQPLSPAAVVPVPAALPLFASALLLGGAISRRRKAAAA
jgi:hypothetical protein